MLKKYIPLQHKIVRRNGNKTADIMKKTQLILIFTAVVLLSAERSATSHLSPGRITVSDDGKTAYPPLTAAHALAQGATNANIVSEQQLAALTGRSSVKFAALEATVVDLTNTFGSILLSGIASKKASHGASEDIFTSSEDIFTSSEDIFITDTDFWLSGTVGPWKDELRCKLSAGVARPCYATISGTLE